MWFDKQLIYTPGERYSIDYEHLKTRMNSPSIHDDLKAILTLKVSRPQKK